MIQLRLLIETKNKDGEIFKNKLYFNTKEAVEEYLNNIRKSNDRTLIDYETECVIVDRW